MSFAPETDNLAKPQALMRVPVGLASPLWGLFAGAAVGGATWWWMTRWARPENLEGIVGAAARFEAEMETMTVTAEAPVVEAAEAPIEIAEPVVETALEPVEEPAPAPVLEAPAEAAPDLESIDGGAAPISPVLEALSPEPDEPAVEDVAPTEAFAEVLAESAPAPRAKKKAAALKAD